MWIYIVIAVLVLLVIYALIMYNSFVKQNNKVREAFSTMDVYLKKRWDLIPNLVEVVKGYAKHEKETLKEIVEIRKGSYDKMTDEDKLKANESIKNDISKIMAIAESYPDLKASEDFIDLSNQLSQVEDEIANSRKYYNAVIRNYNIKIEMFPNSIFAKIFGFKTKSMFEINSDEREDIKVDI